MNQKLREQLDVIDQMLSEPGGDQLWDVLSALRGPDDVNMQDRKQSATVHIRRAAFPLTAAQGEAGERAVHNGDWAGRMFANFGRRTAVTRAMFLPKVPAKFARQDGVDHFENHARKAAIALGLISFL